MNQDYINQDYINQDYINQDKNDDKRLRNILLKVGDTVSVGVRGLKAVVTSVNFDIIMVVQLLDKDYRGVRVVVDKEDLSIVTPLRYWETPETLKNLPADVRREVINSNKSEEDFLDVFKSLVTESEPESEPDTKPSTNDYKWSSSSKLPLYNEKLLKHISTTGEH